MYGGSFGIKRQDNNNSYIILLLLILQEFQGLGFAGVDRGHVRKRKIEHAKLKNASFLNSVRPDRP